MHSRAKKKKKKKRKNKSHLPRHQHQTIFSSAEKQATDTTMTPNVSGTARAARLKVCTWLRVSKQVGAPLTGNITSEGFMGFPPKGGKKEAVGFKIKKKKKGATSSGQGRETRKRCTAETWTLSCPPISAFLLLSFLFLAYIMAALSCCASGRDGAST